MKENLSGASALLQQPKKQRRPVRRKKVNVLGELPFFTTLHGAFARVDGDGMAQAAQIIAKGLRKNKFRILGSMFCA